MKFIVIVGGVMSSLGKGITASSIAVLMQGLQLKVTAVKIDPYLNVDAGTMSPHQHGEVFVLDDGSEVDLDLGNYERFLDISLTQDNSITTGKIYKQVIDNERRGIYLGQTVQVVPHITDAIENHLIKVSEQYDVCIVELGGTIGDIESLPFLHALKSLSMKDHHEVHFVAVSFIPVMKCGDGASEQKTKPTQHTIQNLHCQSIWPIAIICRCDEIVTDETRIKISKTCHVPLEGIISCHNVSPIHRVPQLFHDQGLTSYLCKGMKNDQNILQKWNHRIKNILDTASILNNNKKINIAIIGKYTGKTDTYLSIAKALLHASSLFGHIVNIYYHPYLDDEYIQANQIHGIIIPGGFGDRGIQEKVNAILLARKRHLPMLGICLGLQAMVIAGARSLWPDADSTEFSPTTQHPVIDIMPDHNYGQGYGRTMRLGKTDIEIVDETFANFYSSNKIQERHRHRYEVNYEKFGAQLESIGMKVVAWSASEPKRVEAIHWPLDFSGAGTFFYGTQYHPEFISRPGAPSGPFIGFVHASVRLLDSAVQSCIDK